MTVPVYFRQRLGELHRQWRKGLVIALMFRWLALCAAIVLVYGFCDFWLGLEVPWRVAITALITAVLIGVGWRWLSGVNRLTLHDMGRRADELLGTSQTSILSAYELQLEAEKKKEHPPFTDFLIDRAVSEASARLHTLPARTNYPSHEVRLRLKGLFLLLGVIALLAAWQTKATTTVLSRIFQPFNDLAPYSRYQFRVDPENPQALYGGSADLAVEISGGMVNGPVWLITRRDGQMERTPCFQESPTRFAQKIENVTEPIDFRFETERARSNWKTLAVRLQPHITLARATVTPPAYTRRVAKSFFIGQDNMTVLRGSEVVLLVTSNRPLERGRLILRGRENSSDESVIPAVKSGEHTVRFSWKAESSAQVEVMVSDVQGVESPEPLKFIQKVILDEPPNVVITDPPPFSLATPETILTWRGYAEDDIGLQRAEFVRAVTGYRERSRPLEGCAQQTRVDFQQDIALGTVGAQPGDVLEFYLQASDTNPTMLGVTSSDTVRVQIISMEKYTELIRTRTTVEEFAVRYKLANEKFDTAAKALEDLQKVAADQKSKPEEIEKKLQKARQKVDESKAFFEALRKDFTAFDADGGLKKSAGEISEALQKIAKKLDQTSASDPNLSATAAELTAQMAGPQKQLREETRKGRDIERVAKLMESAQRLSQLVRGQESLVRRIEQRGDEGWQQPLEPLAQRQEQLRQELEQLIDDIEKQSGDLPAGEEYRELGESARKVAQQLKTLKISQDMENGTQAGTNGDRDGADRHGRGALKKLKSLLANCESTGFGALGNGRMTFTPKEDIRSTLQQICNGLGRRFGKKGEAKGSAGTGGGGGYDDDDGYWVGNMSPLSVPVYGPMRIGTHPAEDSSAKGHQAQGGAAVAPLLDAQSSSQVIPTNKDKPRGEALSPEDLPEKYRDSILHYFTNEPKSTP